jgi:hypothetical protein
MPPSDPEHYRRRAVFLLAELTGRDPLDPRLREAVECIEQAAVERIEKRLSKPAPQ